MEVLVSGGILALLMMLGLQILVAAGRYQKRVATTFELNQGALTGLAALWAGLLVATPALAGVLGGPSGVRQATKTIDPIVNVDWGWDNGDLYCNDGTRGEADNYGYCAVCEYNQSWWESYGKLHPELWSKWRTSSASRARRGT